ncbi:cytochrome P450 [Mycena capillaripes]|nr:cytochrome P450 [Mycena capillaripes]
MLLHPEYQVKAQLEIDSIVGKSRLPGFENREHLALVELSVRNVRPLHESGVPHQLMDDDVYSRIVYSSPKSFFPERFLPSPVVQGDPHFVSAYGFGRRICSGQHLADQSLWIAIVSILATCKISNAHHEHGNAIFPDAS